MAVPFQLGGRHFGVPVQAVDDALDAAGQGCAGIADAVAHGVAGADLDRDAALAGKLHELGGEGHDESVVIRAGDILKVAAGADPVAQGGLHDPQVLVHRLGTGQVHLVEDMIVAAGDQDTGFLYAGLFDQFEILLVRPDPGGDLREAEPRVLAQFERFLVIGRVKEELALADHAVRAAEAAHQFEQMQDLLRREGADGLLAVPEGGVGHPDLFGHLHGHMAHVESDLRHMLIVVDLPVEIRLLHVLEGVVIFLLHEQVGGLVKTQHLRLLCLGALFQFIDEGLDPGKTFLDLFHGDGVGQAAEAFGLEGDAGDDCDVLFRQ